MSESPRQHDQDDEHYDEEMEVDEEGPAVGYDDEAAALLDDNTSSDETAIEHQADFVAAANIDSTQLGNATANYTQKSLEPDYDDHDDDDDESKQHNNDDDLAVEGEEVPSKGIEESHDDTSLDEAEEDDNGEEGKNLAVDDETKIDAATNKNFHAKPEATSYSTRGRAHEESHLDRLAAVGDLLSLGNTAATTLLQSPETKIRESFLSDSLTEEERRTRTRYIPAVDGMHALRKQEIKGDLALARSALLVNGVTEKIARSSKRKNTEDDISAMETMENAVMSGEDAIMSAEEDRGTGAITTKTVEIGSNTLNVPSPAFVTPGFETNTKRSTPREVDVAVAFNPPRPPESIGAKKKHRMLRWERRPSDIEVDLSNYRKTVQKTREELKSAEGELERIRVVDNQLRRHFLQHIQCMNTELVHVGDEIATVQQECVDMADLPSNRTRTRGAFKGTNAMKDVLHTLSSKGKEVEAKGLVIGGTPFESSGVCGVGGVSASSFLDWDRSTIIESSKFAQQWIVPGDKVKTPYGVGTVYAVYGPSVVNTTESPHSDLFPKTCTSSSVVNTNDAMEVEETESHSLTADAALGKKKILKAGKKKESHEENISLKHLLAPRVAVRLPFGAAFFNVDSVKSEEDPSKYTDDQLAKRWLGIAESAAAFGATINVSAMDNIIYKEKSAPTTAMDIDEIFHEENSDEKIQKRLVPFGAGMLPTAIGRGTLLHKATMIELDESIDKAFFKGRGVLGMKDNVGFSNEVRKLEDQRQEHLNLRAKVLQLRNQLYRQRRIRMLNEKTYSSSQERASRVESLVAEMRMDLKSLKSRLDSEIRDVGISEEQAESILKTFYMSQDSQHTGEASPPSRSRRFSTMNEDDAERRDGSDIPFSMAGADVVGDTDVSIAIAE
jgi:hypothetical protein